MALSTNSPARLDEAARWATKLLAPSPTARLDTEVLLAHVLGRPRAWVVIHHEEMLSEKQWDQFASLLRRRMAGVPVAQLRGHVEWFDVDLAITPDVLIPRPETELLLERALKLASQRQARVIADIGTGSGSLALVLARSLPNVHVFATDISEPALAVADWNLQSHGVTNVTLLGGNLLEPLAEPPDMIVANLPYLSDEMMDSVDHDVRHEPELALRGGQTGLELYERMFRQAKARAWRAPMVLEIDPRQACGMKNLVRQIFPERSIELLRDYAGFDRVVVVQT